MQSFTSFYELEGQCFTLLVSFMLFDPFQMAVQFFYTASNFPNFDDPNAFFPNSTGPWSPLQKGRKIPVFITPYLTI